MYSVHIGICICILYLHLLSQIIWAGTWDTYNDDHMRTVEDWRLQGNWGLKYLGRFGHQTPDTPESLLVCLTCPTMHVIELGQDAERGGKRLNCCDSCSSHCYIGHDETVSSCHHGWPLLFCWISTPDKASWIALVSPWMKTLRSTQKTWGSKNRLPRAHARERIPCKKWIHFCQNWAVHHSFWYRELELVERWQGRTTSFHLSSSAVTAVPNRVSRSYSGLDNCSLVMPQPMWGHWLRGKPRPPPRILPRAIPQCVCTCPELNRSLWVTQREQGQLGCWQ